jgi:hypothetical protein
MRDGSRQTNKSGRDGERLGRGSERSRGEVWGGSGCCREVKREKRSCTNVKVTKTRQINTSNQTGDTEAKARETALAAWRCFSFSLFFLSISLPISVIGLVVPDWINSHGRILALAKYKLK